MAIELSDTLDTPVAPGSAGGDALVAPGSAGGDALVAPGSAGGDALVAPDSAGGDALVASDTTGGSDIPSYPGASEKTISLDELSGVLGEPVISNVDLTVIEVMPKKMSEHVKSCWGMLMGDLA